ncbi:MAG: hypothetical protein K0S76_495 [Herbinix sp.]|nr:hypothetical protein [Herbinix sp.]
MLYCTKCGYKRYTKRNTNLRGACPVCNERLVPVDGRLSKIVTSLAMSDYMITSAICTAYTLTGISEVEIILRFAFPYNKYIFSNLPDRFEFYSNDDVPYTLNYVLNHDGCGSMLMYNYYWHPDEGISTNKILKQAVDELYTWAKDIKENKWFIYKLGGWL